MPWRLRRGTRKPYIWHKEAVQLNIPCYCIDLRAWTFVLKPNTHVIRAIEG
jgi:hypothetical protein